MFQKLIPTTENLCEQIFEVFSKDFRQGKVGKVRIEETSKNSFEYAGVDGGEMRI